MSAAIPIPKQSIKEDRPSSFSSPSAEGVSLLSSPSFSSSSCPSSSSSSSSSSSPSPSKFALGHRRRQSLLSSSISKQEHTVFDLGTRDGTARLVTCVKTGQGFDWNQEMFLPHHSDITVPSLNDRVDPVHEIFLDDADDGTVEVDPDITERKA